MKEIKTPMQAVRVTLECDCGTEMTFDGMMLPTAPPMYRHFCKSCGAKHNARAPFPTTAFEPLPPPPEPT